MKAMVINAPATAQYLDEFMTELPIGLFDKGKTNCGGTELAINNDEDIIIAVPYKSLIKNKVQQHRDILLGIYGKPDDENELQPATNDEIIEYVTSHSSGRKLMVTYDSIGRLIRLLLDNGIAVYDIFHLLIDEWHILFNSYVFRYSAIKSTITEAAQFSKVTYMTATPIEEEFILEELIDLPVTRVQWSNVVDVRVTPIPTNSVMQAVLKYIKNVMDGKIFGNLHFFVNSVDFITEAIQRSGLLPEQVKVVCSNNKHLGRGRKSNQSKLGDKYQIQEPLDAAKLINFYTSTCFEGCDIHDEHGKTFIVSDKSKSHTLIDISTLGIQICGRIRDSKYNTEMYHIFSETRYSTGVSLEEFKQVTYKVMIETEEWVRDVNSMGERSRITTIDMFERDREGSTDIKYAIRDGNMLRIDKNLFKVDIMNFKIAHHLYESRVSLQDEYRRNNFTVAEADPLKFTDKLLANPKARISFKELYGEYAMLREQHSLQFQIGNLVDRKRLIENEKPMIKDAYEILGNDEVKRLGYDAFKINRELIKHSNRSKDAKVIELIKLEIPFLTPILCSELKESLQRIYNSVGKICTAKAIDLKEWFKADKKTFKVNGKNTDHYIIIRQRVVY